MSGPSIVIFDSGLGGLTVLREVRIARPDAELIYLADTAAFPYGALSETAVIVRVMALIDDAAARFAPDLVVIACNTASTLVLPYLRAAFNVPFVGTVPAIKPAAHTTRSGMVSVLGTPGTVKRDYTKALIDTFAYHLQVTLIGAPRLAGLAEAALRGEPVGEAAIAEEIAPAFVKLAGRHTDTIVLACTHYPLLQDHLERFAPWPVTWIDPAAAIARRAASLLGDRPQGPLARGGRAIFTAKHENVERLGRTLRQFGIETVTVEPFVGSQAGMLAQL